MLTYELRENPLYQPLPPGVTEWLKLIHKSETMFRGLIIGHMNADLLSHKLMKTRELKSGPPVLRSWLERAYNWLPLDAASWWSHRLWFEPTTDFKSVPTLQTQMLSAVLVYDGDSPVAAAGLVQALGEKRLFNTDRIVVGSELSGAYVTTAYRRRGTATEMIRRLLVYADEHKLKVTFVPNNPSFARLAMQFGAFAATSWDDAMLLCYCRDWDTGCSFCPRNGKVWRFPYPALPAISA